ncbi:MAG: hypothetical protein QXW97_04695 [Candidatus Pacearchaeota archaeon]
MAKFFFRYKGTEYNLNVIVCKTIFQKMRGLMFRKNSKPLLFLFSKPVFEPIHSFFCVPFIAIWFLGDKIIGVKYVKPWKVYILPKKNFDKLLEIPFNDENFRYILGMDRKI